MRALALAAALVLAALGAAPAGAQTINSPAFAPLSGGARAYALSGAEVALADDAAAAFVNPARLAFLRGSSMVLGYARLVEDVPSDRGELSYALPLGDPIAAPFQQEGAYRTVIAFGAEYQRLELSQGSGYHEVTGTIAASLAPAHILAFGVAVRGLTTGSDVDGLQASGTALDLGFSIALLPDLEAAIVGHNITGSVKYEGRESEKPGRSAQLGLAFTRWRWAQAEADLIDEYDGAKSLAFGVEVLPQHVLTLRGGLRQWLEPESRTVPSAGVGFRRHGIFFDYAARFDTDEALGLQHRVSLGLRP